MKNRFDVQGKITIIRLGFTGGAPVDCLIDTEDLGEVAATPVTWFPIQRPRSRNKTFNVCGHIEQPGMKKQLIYLHRLLLREPRGLIIDHINHNGLDNRRCNLRAVTQSQNMQNLVAPVKGNKSGCLGVYWDSRKHLWAAAIRSHGKLRYFARFHHYADAVEAATRARALMLPCSQEALIGGEK